METKIPSSFRDPSSSVYLEDDVLYRRVDPEDYSLLMKSGLYSTLSGRLVRHEEVDKCTIKPTLIPFISYPYEWCFSQLKDAALLTLDIQRTALKFGMTLKDASAYNVQFVGSRPVFIDTGSFTKRIEGEPWIAYRQFCQHFVAPLALMSYKDARLSQLLRTNIDGIPLDLASKLLPKLRPSLLAHVHLHAKSQRHFVHSSIKLHMHESQLVGLVRSLRSCVSSMKCNRSNSWADYQTDEGKKETVTSYIKLADPKTVWDLGGNTGAFSEIAYELGATVMCFDSDHDAIDQAYNSGNGFLPLVLDLTNPSPGIGWHGQERMSLVERGPADLVMALALVHHLAIANNVPLGMIAEFLGDICHYLVIEFVPKTDRRVQELLRTREDIFPDYTEAGFEKAFGEHFRVLRKEGTDRILYLMEAK